MTEPLKIIAGAPDRPLIIGEIEIPCYVLEDETRVLTQTGIIFGLGITRGPSITLDGGAQLPRFAASKALAPHIIGETMDALKSPIRFVPPQGGRNAFGYPATLLPEICDAYLIARAAGDLQGQQMHVAARCELLVRGLARVGIIALVDEATGYQEIRARYALATILEKFIAAELQSWTKTFPYAFYEQIFRLKGWSGPDGVKRPSVIGHYTNDFVYARLAPGVLEELQDINPTLPEGHRKDRHHQWFTPDFGHPKLREHIAGVTALMRAAPNWNAFKRSLQRAYPRLNEQVPMLLENND